MGMPNCGHSLTKANGSDRSLQRRFPINDGLML